MSEEKDFYQVVEAICANDSRYKADAYEFIMHALHFTQNKFNRPGHLSAAELLGGIREYIIQQYGPMAKTVLIHWGIHTTADFGNIVFNMVSHKLLSKTEQDSLADFKDVYNFEDAFGNAIVDGIIKHDSKKSA